MKKTLFLAVLIMATLGLRAQVNIQEMYDFNRGHFTTTLEMFKADNWGSTFFFNDIYHPSDFTFPTDYYTEIARSINFWQNSKLGALSAHVEWNGGLGNGYGVNNAWLFGVEYFLHSADFSNTFTFELLYKDIRGKSGQVPIQFTFVWGMNDFIGVKGLVFCGFLDIWGEKNEWNVKADNPAGYTTETTDWVILSEPQIWYNLGQHFGCENLFIGGEVEIAYNFSGGCKDPAFIGPLGFVYSNQNKGLTIAPAAGIKWNF